MIRTFETRSRHERITISTIDVAVALSILLHVLALWTWPRSLLMRPFDDDLLKAGESGGRLAVRLAPPPSPAPAIESRPSPVPTPTLSAPGGARRPPPAPRVLAMERPSRPAAPVAAPAQPAAPEQNPALLGQDLASYVAARRRAREPEPGPPSTRVESEQERTNREAAERLGLNRAPTFGSNKITGGGTFQISELYYDRAVLAFYGWNKAIQRVSLQRIEVARGDNPSIELAVVRKVVAIIREEASGDFHWESLRLGRDVTLSARPADTAGLEAFLMEEFFTPTGVRR
jgi:hypothetical protein